MREVVEVPSSQESSKPAWWSERGQCMVRMSGSCLQQATMQEGPEGFALACWPDGTTEQTDRANLSLQNLHACTSSQKQHAAATFKRPAASKKPAAATESVAPALPHTSALLVGAGAWEPSFSFGLMKLTRATGKSYIQAKEKEACKPYCLVNVMGGSCKDHKALGEQLLRFAKAAGLTKEMVVAERDSMIAREGGVDHPSKSSTMA